MLTLQQAYEVKASIQEYLKATFNFKDRALNLAFESFVEGLFKGPYISLKLPFRKAEDEPIPLEIKPGGFVPFLHQLQAFNRLTTENHAPESTILTTGTGSGKTEAFLYPILDYCYKNRTHDGIKVIILYPMNALATDQAKRLAETIYNDERLHGIRAGLFIGESQDRKKSYPRSMSAENIIESRDEILAAPPDILLTNFKMLDFNLMQARYHSLWQHNIGAPERLKFLILDELHTYEGAQGSDVANLIRRLKLKLHMPEGHLCPVGTSATIGSGDESKILLADFATQVFGEEFPPESIIEEHRLSPDEFFTAEKLRNFIPTASMLAAKQLQSGNEFNVYIRNQLQVWGLDPAIDALALAEELKTFQLFKDVISICDQGIISVDDLLVKLNLQNREFAALPMWDEHHFSPKQEVIRSILSLISHAKSGDATKQFPFLNLQVQLWIRELSGLVRVVSDEPIFKWRQDIDVQNSEKALPAWFCRECGASGWLAVKQEDRDNFENDINEVYQKYFGHHKNLYLVAPYSEENRCIDEYEPTDTLEFYLNKFSLTLHSKPNENSFRVLAYRKLSGNYNLHICPSCNAKNTINIMGARVSTLNSIATSQLLATDLDPNVEKYRKVLAFTNSVQDAAHQAGFIEARNVRFTFRTALQKVINMQMQPLDLVSLQNAFFDYWQHNADESGVNHLDAYFHKFFPQDHAADVDMNRFKRQPEEFIQEFNNRVAWEIASEFGYNAIIGRTLEKTGSSATFYDPETLESVFSHMLPWLGDNALAMITKEEFLHFLLIFLHRLRRRGGVDHVYLNRFRTGRSSYYLITQATNQRHFFMRNFGKDTRLPKLLTDTPNRFGVFDLTTRSTSTNWFHTYFTKAFPLAPDNTDLVNEFYTELLNVLAMEKIDLLDEKTGDGVRNFAIKPERLFVARDVEIFECDTCSDRLSITPHNSTALDGAVCMVYRCTGHYRKTANAVPFNYYQQVYSRGRAPRVYAADHTGLLDRAVREKLENDYKTRPKFNSINALVATSTLEMGIDIGTLNSAINTSVPPLPSNFLQRIGRAGRGSGSAVILNFCPNNAHDLYYFESPGQMMSGRINTPGCYLEAKEILRRHFFAFCIDSWTLENPGENIIPSTIKSLNLENLDIHDPNFFLNSIIYFIKKKSAALLADFARSFQAKVSPEFFDSLGNQIVTNHLFDLAQKAFIDVKNEVLNYRQKIDEIIEYAQAKYLDKSDPEYLELVREQKNIRAMLSNISRRQVLEHMINQGLLPNYAFPETGVTLKAQVSRRKDENPGSYAIKSYEVVRPARSAIKELIPDNLFYTQGYKFKISGVNVASWSEEVLDFRFCSTCDYLSEDIPPVTEACPKCGGDSWRSSMNTHKMIRLKAVNSFDNERDAKVDDSAEERERKSSNLCRHFKFNEKSVQGSWSMLQMHFGIEYVKDVQLIEFNTGLVDARVQHNNTIAINGEELPRSGYIICKNCGKATTSIYTEKGEPLAAKDYHFGFCKHKDRIYSLKPDDYFEEVFFYRRMNTEAIKILLPVQEFNTKASIKLFKAGLMIGLKNYFRGNPDHLELAEYAEYNQQTQRHDQFLVLFDVIPGGTGYLSKLFDKDEFNGILKNAYYSIQQCNCQLDGKDGCYNCIYTYGNQFERELLSREQAEKLFARIVSSADQWEYSSGGLTTVRNASLIEESELEERFVRILANYFNSEQNPNTKFHEKRDEFSTHYIIEIHKNDESVVFELRPQVELSPDDGVQYTTIADFMLTCIEHKINGQSTPDVLTAFKPVAIYLDGYLYHAAKGNNRLITDLKKRKSILDSNKYLVWILTWNDLDLFEGVRRNKNASNKDYLKEIYDHDIPQSIHAQIEKHPLVAGQDNSLLKKNNSLERLIWLMNTFSNEKIHTALNCFIYHYQSSFPNNGISMKDAQEFQKSVSNKFDQYKILRDPDVLNYIDLLRRDAFYEFRMMQELKTLNISGSLFFQQSEDAYEKSAWQNFWTIFNVVQFSFAQFFIPALEATDRKEAAVKKATIDEILENFDELYHPLVKELVQRNIAFNRDDYFTLMDEDDTIIAEAFIGLPELKIVIDPLDDLSAKSFEKYAYAVYKLDAFDLNKL